MTVTASTIPATGRSAIWVSNNVLGVQDVAVRAPGAGEVLIRIRACGICGSDLHAFHASQPRRTLPGIGPGHELAGEVVALGDGVQGPPAGTHVVMLAGTVCGECSVCRSGQEQRCAKLRIAGGSYPGGMGEYFMAQAGFVYPVPEDMPWPIAALSEPCAISLHALKRAGIVRGQRVLVLGAGAIGLFAVLVAHDAGASATRRCGLAPRTSSRQTRCRAAQRQRRWAGTSWLKRSVERRQRCSRRSMLSPWAGRSRWSACTRRPSRSTPGASSSTS